MPPPRLALVILAVPELSPALRFYRAAFDWPQVVDAPSYAEFSHPDGQRLGLYQREGFGANVGRTPHRTPAGALAPTELYFYADDLEAAVARLLAAEAKCLSPLSPRDWGDEAAYFEDPCGNVLVLARPLKPSPP
jgi:catechol 2,3-dioxygenase-like lactoylglutathione lyase family enzyme